MTFPPTYKSLGQQTVELVIECGAVFLARYVVGGGDLSPARTPAWCDRVIYRFEPSAACMRLEQ